MRASYDTLFAKAKGVLNFLLLPTSRLTPVQGSSLRRDRIDVSNRAKAL